jgi:hypothetical protein
MTRIRVRDKRLGQRVVDKNNVPYLFYVRNMFFANLGAGLFPSEPGAFAKKPNSSPTDLYAKQPSAGLAKPMPARI